MLFGPWSLSMTKFTRKFRFGHCPYILITVNDLPINNYRDTEIQRIETKERTLKEENNGSLRSPKSFSAPAPKEKEKNFEKFSKIQKKSIQPAQDASIVSQPLELKKNCEKTLTKIIGCANENIRSNLKKSLFRSA